MRRPAQRLKEIFKSIALQDIDKQARFVEIFGILGFIGLIILMAIVLLIKIDLTVPAPEEAKIKGVPAKRMVVERKNLFELLISKREALEQ